MKYLQLFEKIPLFHFGSRFHVLFQLRAVFLSAFLRLLVLIQGIFLSAAGLSERNKALLRKRYAEDFKLGGYS